MPFPFRYIDNILAKKTPKPQSSSKITRSSITSKRNWLHSFIAQTNMPTNSYGEICLPPSLLDTRQVLNFILENEGTLSETAPLWDISIEICDHHETCLNVSTIDVTSIKRKISKMIETYQKDKRLLRLSNFFEALRQ